MPFYNVIADAQKVEYYKKIYMFKSTEIPHLTTVNSENVMRFQPGYGYPSNKS